MIDIHAHILPSLDDGPSSLQESVEMARIAAEDGISLMVATPHFSYGERPSREDIREKTNMIAREFLRAEIPLQILSGADIRLTYELLQGIERGEVPTINGSRYFLLELPDPLPPNLDVLIFSATVKGLVPIITHPERNHSLLSSPMKAERLRDSGALFQITGMSFTGEFGVEIQRYAYRLLKVGMVDFVASDAHNRGSRPPVLSRAYRAIQGYCDQQQLSRIFNENPEAVISDGSIIS